LKLATRTKIENMASSVDVDQLQQAVGQAGSASYGIAAKILESQPNLSSLKAECASMLNKARNQPVEQQKALIAADLPVLRDCLVALADKDQGTYVVAFLVELARNDSSVYDIYSKAFANVDIFKQCNTFINCSGHASDENAYRYAVDKCAYLLTGLMISDSSKNLHRHLQQTLQGICEQWPLSDSGRVDALANLLKLEDFRETVWGYNRVQDIILSPTPSSAPPLLYKCAFSVWLISFQQKFTIAAPTMSRVTDFLKAIVMSCRVEKIIRVSLEAIRNFLKNKTMASSIVEGDAYNAVSSLEYEKWRDQQMYEDIREVSALLEKAQAQHTVFERYEAELHTGKLKRSFIHSEKFWLENVLKFDKDDFAAIKSVIKMLSSDDPETLAVACFDIGEFARLHPTGKMVLSRFNAKQPVMLLMTHTQRDVAREALLCVQKLMLGKNSQMAN